MSTFAPTTKAALSTAITAWISNSTTATTTYGLISTWDVSAITDMSSLFANKTTFNGDISSWNVSQVTTMEKMFNNAFAFNQPIGSWDVSQVTTMSIMFSGASAFNQPLNAWNVSNVSNMDTMFNGSAYNQPLNSWNVSNVTIMNSMFNGTPFNQSLDLWNVIKVTNMNNMFKFNAAFNQPLNSWNVSNVTKMFYMFGAASTFNQSLNSWNVSNVTDMTYMFGYASAFNGNISAWNVSNLLSMQQMFEGAVAFNGNISAWNTMSNKWMNSTFKGATLFNQDISSWNVSKVTSMDSTFMNAPAFNRNIRKWYVASVLSFTTMFTGATAMLASQGATATPTAAYFNQVPANTAPVGLPTISGSVVQVGYTLTAVTSGITDADGLGVFSYVWKRGATTITGATSVTYILTATDVGQTITVTVSYLDGHGTTQTLTSAATATVALRVNTLPTGPLTITPLIPSQGQTMSIETNSLADVDGLGPITWQWKRNGLAISGATGTSYVLTQSSVGMTITLTASYTDGFGAPESFTSNTTAAVIDVNDPPTGAVTISGIAVRGQTLTLEQHTISDFDGAGNFTWQWKSDGVAISGATGISYTLTQADVGKTITLTASYTDSFGAASVTSAATVPVTIHPNTLPGGSIGIIPIAPSQGQTMSIETNSLADVDGLGPITWQWKSNGFNISGATGTTYFLTQASVGKTITLTASYTDGFGAAESVTSNTTAAVGNVNDLPVGQVIAALNIVGPAERGKILTASTSGIFDMDGLGTFSYQWMRNNVDILYKTGSTYELSIADVGQYISVRVSYTDGQNTRENITSAQVGPIVNKPNNLPTGSITITAGTPSQNQTLSLVENTLADVDGLSTFTWQWKSNGINIDGATGTSYTLKQAEVGKTITLTASYTDLEFNNESVTSAATAAVVNVNDVPSGLPIINGNKTQGQVLTADVSYISDTDGLGVFSYQWMRNGSDISGATASTYALVQFDVGKAISVLVNYTDGYGRYEVRVSDDTALVGNVNDLPGGSLTISGTPVRGQILTAITSGLSDLDGLGAFSYQWMRNGANILLLATGSTYTLVQADVGYAISVRVSYTDSLGAAESVTSANFGPIDNKPNNLPGGSLIITPLIPSQGQTMSIQTNSIADVDGLGPITWQWKSNGSNINGATGSTYVLTQAEVGKTITLTASYTDLEGNNESVTSAATAAVVNANDLPAGEVTISGTPTQKEVLTAITSGLYDLDGLGAFSYQWMRAGANISGATASTYTLVQADVGQAISVKVSYTDMLGAAESKTSVVTTAVTNVPDPLTGSLTISGTPARYAVLTAITSGLSDLDGLGVFSYQWMRNNVDILSATASTYTLVLVDAGNYISVRASYTDSFGAAESVTSALIGPIANVNTLPSGEVSITGTPEQNQVLTVSNNLGDVDGLGPITYQWKSNGTAISGATAATYTLTQAEVGKTITVTASYTDGGGYPESKTSAATTAVVNVDDVPATALILNGTRTQGFTLTADSSGIIDLDGMNPPFTYKFFRRTAKIGGVTTAAQDGSLNTYTLTQADVGRYMHAFYYYYDAISGIQRSVGSTVLIETLVGNANDLPGGEVTISGTLMQGFALTASNTLTDLDGAMGLVSYQWKRNGTAISDATSATYLLVEADVGKTISVTASYTDAAGYSNSKTIAATVAVANWNDPLTGWVGTTGTTTQGETLTAVLNALADADGMGPVSYQWKRNGVAISGATGSTYLLVEDDVNRAINVTASYTDGHGTLESASSLISALVGNVNDLPGGSLTISGTPTQKEVLTAITSGLSDLDGLGAFSYQWMRAGSNISGATGSTYTLVQADVGYAITVTASYTDLHGTPESVTSAATTAVANANDLPTGEVTIAGTPIQGNTLTLGTNTIADADGLLGPFSYQWKRGGVAISGATGTSYQLTPADADYVITLTASYTDITGVAESVTSAATTAVYRLPFITGIRTQGETLTVDLNGITHPIFTSITMLYQWYRTIDFVNFARRVKYSSSDTTYTLTPADVGYYMYVVVTWRDGDQTRELDDYSLISNTNSETRVTNVNDLPGGSLTISGTPARYAVLTAITSGLSDPDGLGVFSYQWMRNNVDISGATASTYALVLVDVDNYISVRASYTDLQGTPESVTSANFGPIANVNTLPSGEVSIAGTPTQNQVLTVSNNLGDVDGLGPITYQWKSNGTAISGATAATYTLTQAEVGKTITVTASYTDGFGAAESKTSAATTAVVNVDDIPAANSLILSGTRRQGFTLTADISNIVDLDGMNPPFTYRFNRMFMGALISTVQDGPLNTYTLTIADFGHTMQAFYFYYDAISGIQRSVSSSLQQESPVDDVNDAPTGEVNISGTLMQGFTLTASNTLADLDGMGTVSYQWNRNGTAISGVISTTYQLVEADVGSAISVTASYTDGGGWVSNHKTSAATPAIDNWNDPLTGWVGTTGTLTQGQLLTAVLNALADADGMGPVSYQWKRNGVAISGATGSTYLLVEDDVNRAINVTASYTDGHGTLESASSLIAGLVGNVNDLPGGSLTISGTPTQNQLLVAVTSGLSDLDGLGAFSYQWMRAGANISGATGSTYTLVQADVGQAISVTVSYTDGHGTLESKTSALIGPITNANDLPSGEVTIAGTPTQNEVLTVSNNLGDVDGLGPITYQWNSNGTAISGATAETYTLTQAEVSKTITVTASYTDITGVPESKTSAATTAVGNVDDAATGRAVLTGTRKQGYTLTADISGIVDLDGINSPFTYKFTRISNKTFPSPVQVQWTSSNTYTLTQTEVGRYMQVTFYYVDAISGLSKSVTSNLSLESAVGNVNDLPGGSLTIIPIAPSQNQTMSIETNSIADVDGLGPITWQWKSNGINIDGATGTTYFLTQADVGKTITLTASYTDGFGAAESVTSNTTAAVGNVNDLPGGSLIISPNAVQYQTLSIVTNTIADVDGLGPFTWQWKSNGINIDGATDTTYTLFQADVGKTFTVTATYTDGCGTIQSVTSAATLPVANAPDAPTGPLIITPLIPSQGQTMSIETNSLADVDGLGAITWQWKSNGINIDGATGTSYTLTQADVGKTITLTASYTDGFGTAESFTSNATAAVGNVNDLPGGSLIITPLIPSQNQTMSIQTNGIEDVDGLGPITWQWKSDGVAISGATGTTYVLTEAEVGKTITLTASYKDLQNTNESVTSNATAAVGNVNDSLVGHVMIDGDLTHGQTLTASHSFSDVDGFSTAVSHKWMKNGVEISGAVGSTYTLTPADIGAKISVTASYTDGHGSQESKTSAETYQIQPIRAAYSLLTKGIETMSMRAPVNGKIIIADAVDLVVTSSNNAGALSDMTSVEKHSWIKQNASALLSKYTPSLGSDKLYVSKSLLPFAATSLLTTKVELIDAKSSSVASPLVRVRDASMGAFYMDTQPGNSVTLTYSPDSVVITHTSDSAFTVAINGGSAVSKSIGDKILLKNVVLTLGSITGEPNNLPVFVKNAPTTVYEDASYSYTVSVSDADNDTFTVTAPILPSWLTFSAGTLSCLSVPSSVVGSHPVQFLAEDIWGGQTYYDFTITVQNVLVTGTVTSSASLKYSDLNTVQTPVLKAVHVSESDATVIINTATVNGVDVRSYLQLDSGPSDYIVKVKTGQHAALLTLLRTNPGNVSVAIKVTDISAQTSPIYVIETITVVNDSPTTTQQFPSSMTIIEDSSTAYAQSGGADSAITFSEACSVVLNGTYKDYFMLVATDGTSRTYKLKCKDLASARAIIPGTSYSLTVTATSSANALTVTSTSLSVQSTNILATAIVGGAKILTHASLQAYITSSAAIPNIATITLSESDPQSITLQTVTVNGSSVDKTYFTMSGSAGNYVLSVNTSAASQLLTRLSALISISSAYSMLMTFQVVEQGGNAFTQTITVAASNNIIKVSLKSTVTNVPNMFSYSVSGSVATVAMNYSATPVIDYADYIISDANSAVGTRAVGGGIAYDGATLPTMYVGVSLVKSIVYQSPGEWIVTYYESYSGVSGSQSNTLTLKFSVRGAINFVLSTLNAGYELSQALSIVGNYTAPAPFTLPTVTLQMSASQFNADLFQIELVDSNIHTLTDPATEAMYFSEQIRYYADHTKFPELKSIGNKYLRELAVVNGSAHASTHLRQRNAGVDGIAASMVHELAYQLTGISLMDDQLANGALLKTAMDNYLDTALPAFVKLQLANCNGKTQNISGASDMTDQRNVPRELFMQIVESVVGDKLGTHSARSSRLNTLFHSSNLAGGKYGIKFIAGDTLRFTVTISPSATAVDYIVDGVPHAAQEARAVEVVITMM